MFNIKFRKGTTDKTQGGEIVSYKKEEIKVVKKEKRTYGLLTEKVATYENKIEKDIRYNEAVQDINKYIL